MIDTCFSLLDNLFKNISGDPLLPNVTLIKQQGFDFNSTLPIKGIITGLNIQKYLVDPRCFSCESTDVNNSPFTPGIWTTAIQTNISKEVDGITYYWFSTSVDSEGNGIFANLYTHCNFTHTVTLKEENIPIFTDGSFYGFNESPIGNKILVLYKVTPTSIITLFVFRSDIEILPRSFFEKIEDINIVNLSEETTSLEELSIGLIYLLQTEYQINEFNTLKIFDKYDKDYYFSSKLENIINILTSLIDYYSITDRYGSIPHNLLTNTSSEKIYDDTLYQKEYISFLQESKNKIAYTSYNFNWSLPYLEEVTTKSNLEIPSYTLEFKEDILLDSFTLYGNDITPRFSSVLEEGKTYLIKIQGIINDGNFNFDPNYYSIIGDFSDRLLLNPALGNGLFIEGEGFFNGSEDYNTNHLYTLEYIGKGEELRFNWYEDNLFNIEVNENNSGSFSIEIYERVYTLTIYDNDNVLYKDDVYSDDLTFTTEVAISYYKNNCLEDKCYLIVPNIYLSDRTVYNKSIAWFLILLCEYSSVFNKDYLNEINVISEYLCKQINDNKLIKYGWDHNDILNDSQLIEIEDLYTNVICLIALSKAYSCTLDTHYLYIASTLNRSIYKNFYNGTILNQNEKANDITASLLYSICFKRKDLYEKTLDYIKPRLNYEIIQNQEEIDLFNLEDNNYINKVLCLDILSTFYKINEIKGIFHNNIEKHCSFSYLSSCITNKSILEILNIPYQEVTQTKHIYLRQFIKELPIDFDWFSLEALQSGNLYLILKSIFNVIAPLFGRIFTTKRTSYRSLELEANLNLIEREVSLKKLEAMTFNEYKEFILNFVEEGSLKEIVSLLDYFKISSLIEHVTDRLSNLNGINTIGNSLIGNSYIQGNPKYMNNSFELIVNNHIRIPILNLIKNLISVGFYYEIIEKLNPAISDYDIKDETINCINIKIEDSARQILINKGYSFAEVTDLMNNLESCLENIIGLTDDEIDIYKYDPRPILDKLEFYCLNN